MVEEASGDSMHVRPRIPSPVGGRDRGHSAGRAWTMHAISFLSRRRQATFFILPHQILLQLNSM